MLTLASLELARAKRRRLPLLSCRTTGLQVAAAAIQAATVERSPVLITIDATSATTLPHRPLLGAILEMGREAVIPVCVEAVIPPERSTAAWWFSNGVLVVTLTGELPAITRALKHVTSEAVAHGAEVGVELRQTVTTHELQKLAQSGISFLRVPPKERLTEMQELVSEVSLPLIAAAPLATPKKTRDLVLAGCAGITVGEELHEAYTAGVRTALRNRHANDPAQYLGYGATAVREYVRSTLNYFHT